jgi:hypothetical protein
MKQRLPKVELGRHSIRKAPVWGFCKKSPTCCFRGEEQDRGQLLDPVIEEDFGER